MALQLDDLKEGVGLSVSDFEAGAEDTGARLNDKSTSQLAATDSLLTDPSPERYNKVKSELADPASRKMYMDREAERAISLSMDSEKELINIISDPTLSDDEKTIMVAGAGIQGAEAAEIGRSTLAVLAETSLIADSEGETEDNAESRFRMTDAINGAIDYKQNMARLVNDYKNSKNVGVVDTAVDLGEIMVPFAEWFWTSRVQDKLVPEGERAVGMGQQTRAMIDQMKTLPLNERAKMAEGLIELISQNDQVLLTDGNDLKAVALLENMLVEDDYSDFEKWFDTVAAVADAAFGVGTIARMGLKSAQKAKAVKTLGKVPGPMSTEMAPQTIEGALVELQATNKHASNGITIGDDVVKDAVKLFDEEERAAIAATTHTPVSPVAPSQIVKDTNPSMARKTHVAAMTDESGQAAEALYGTNKMEAAASDLLPTPRIDVGFMPNKVEHGAQFAPDEDVVRILRADGHTGVSDAELALSANKIKQDLAKIVGKVHSNTIVVRTVDNGAFQVGMRFSPTDSGWKTADEALEQAEYAFQDWDIPREAFTLFERSKTGEWVATDAKTLTAKKALREAAIKAKKKIPDEVKEIDYAIGLDYTLPFSPDKLSITDILPTGNSVSRALESISPNALVRSKQGSLVQHVFDPSSVVHPQIVNAAGVAVDKTVAVEKAMVEMYKDFISFWKSSDNGTRKRLTDYINEANFEGIRFNPADLMARGFNEKEIKALKQWRRAGDTLWHVSNRDMVKSLKASGHKALVVKGNDTMLVGRPLSREAAGKAQHSKAYDPSTEEMVDISDEFLKDLYAQGGESFKLSSPVEIGGKMVDVAIARNTPTTGFTRELLNHETVLAYRDGYYPVMYDANFFVYRTVRTEGGGTVEKVMASAKTRKDAENMRKVLREKFPDDDPTAIDFRRDRRSKSEKRREMDQGAWATAQSAGLTSQRVRGKRLIDASAGLENMGHTNLKDPLQAIGTTIRQLSERASVRDFLDTAKSRWMQGYGPHLDLPVDKYTGKKMFPASIDDLKALNDTKQGILSDAKTNFNYISSLENGYINQIDEGFKAAMQGAAELLGKGGHSRLEKGAYAAAEYSPTQKMKTLAFKLFISSNPGRQAVIQRGQILQLGAVNPKYSVGLVQDMSKILYARIAEEGGIAMPKEWKALLDEVKDLGVLEAVDAHTLTRRDSLVLADQSIVGKIKDMGGQALHKAGAGKVAEGIDKLGIMRPVQTLQKVGFDWAEQDVLLSSYLSHRDMYMKANKLTKLTRRDKEKIFGQARAYTLMMNRAGEMAYTQNTLGMLAQFLSFRHKALMQGISNKALTKMERAQILGYNTMLFGVDATAFSFVYNQIWGDTPPSDTKDAIEAGLMDITLNKAMSEMSGDSVAVDFGDLAPTEAMGMWQGMAGMFSTSPAEILTSLPSTSLFFGNNPRITNAFKAGAMYFAPTLNYEDPELKVTFSDVVKASALAFSGYSTYTRSKIAAEQGKKISSSGNVTDDDVSTWEAVWSLAGLPTKQEKGMFEYYEKFYEGADTPQEDYDLWYSDLKRHLTRRGQSIAEDQLGAAVLGEAWKAFGDDRPRAWLRIVSKLESDATKGDFSVMKGLMNKMGLSSADEVSKLVNALPPGGVRDQLVELMQFGEQ